MKRNFIAKRFQSAGTGLTLDTAALAKYKDIVDLSIGDTDFTTDEAIINAAFRDAKAGHTHYGDPKGDPELISAVCKAWEEDFDQTLPRDHVLVSASSCLGMSLAMFAILDPGDEVIVFSPYFALYRAQIELAGGVCVDVPTYAEEDYAISEERLRAAITPRTKCLILPYPNNPTGGIMEKADLEKIAQVVRETGILVISDEIYGELTYGDRTHISFASLPCMWQYTITLNGFSKAFAMTGWRVGYACGPKEILSVMLKIHQYSILCAPRMGQVAALEALQAGRANDYEDVRRMRDSYDRRRRLMVDSFRKMGLDCFEPLGAFYVFPSIKKTGLDSETFCERLLNEYKIATVPGTAFGECGEGHIRCSYATGVEKLNIALERMSEFVDKCGK